LIARLFGFIERTYLGPKGTESRLFPIVILAVNHDLPTSFLMASGYLPFEKWIFSDYLKMDSRKPKPVKLQTSKTIVVCVYHVLEG
jgi:hypothetical protein